MFKTQIASFETEMKPTEPREAAMHRPATETTAALRPMVYASLFAALTAVGAYISVPIGPVPIVMQNMFVFLAGLLLGSRWGLASLAVYLLAGACGLPVFAGGTGGIARFAGPTGGFLLGYLPVVFWVGWIAERRPGSMLRDVAAMVCGAAVLYVCGVPWLMMVTGMPLSKALAVGMLPFLVGDALKIGAAALIAKSVRPLMRLS
jgi:biotin transport system substrate-specific component